jgi:LDH2 family malate/lactate/ureidoglycolate dehydrogenase
MATSAVALFGVLTAKATGAPLAEGVAYDASGNVTTDAGAVLDGGAIATFGGHKGAGLALCVELLAGALSGGAVVGQEVKKEAKNWGHLFLCVKPDALVDDFDAKAAAVCKAVKDAGARVPGDRSAAEAAARVKADELPIPTKIWESITRTAEHGLAE